MTVNEIIRDYPLSEAENLAQHHPQPPTDVFILAQTSNTDPTDSNLEEKSATDQDPVAKLLGDVISDGESEKNPTNMPTTKKANRITNQRSSSSRICYRTASTSCTNIPIQSTLKTSTASTGKVTNCPRTPGNRSPTYLAATSSTTTKASNDNFPPTSITRSTVSVT